MPKTVTFKLTALAVLCSTLSGFDAFADTAVHPDSLQHTASQPAQKYSIGTIRIEENKPIGEITGGKEGVYADNISSSFKDKQDVDTFRGTSVADVLQGMAGVYSGDARNSGAIDPNVRGIQGQGRVPVTVDGTEQGITVYRGYAGANNRNYIDPLLIGSIRVEKGPSLTRGLENSIGGGIAIKTIGVNDIVKPGQKFGIDLRVEQGNNAVKPRTPHLENYIGKPWQHSMDPYLDYYPVKNDWQGNPIPKVGYPSMLTAIEPKHGKIASWKQDQAYRIAAGMRTDAIDIIAAYAYRKRGNYFTGRGGIERYKTTFSSVTKLFDEGSEVTNTSNTTESILLKGTLRLTENQGVELMFNRMESDYGDIMPSRIRGMIIYPTDPDNPNTTGPNMLNALHLVPQWELSHLTLNTYGISYTWNPDNRWIDLKAGIWATNAKTNTQNSGGSPLDCIGKNPFSSTCPPGSILYNSALYNSEDTRYGINLSNRIELTNNLTVTFAGSLQHQKLRSPDDWWLTENYNGLRMMPQEGTRQEYKFDFNFDWKPTKRLLLSAGARYNEYWSKDDGLQALFNSNSPNKAFFQNGLINAPVGMRLSFTGGTDSQGRPYDDSPGGQGHYDMLYDERGKFTVADNPFMNGEAEKNGWKFRNVNIISPGTPMLNSDRREDESRTYPVPVLSDVMEKRKEHAWSPVLSVAYMLTDDIRIYARYAEATHMPSLFATSYGFSGFSPLNTRYKPEQATNIEFGCSHDLRHLFAKAPDKADIKISYYHNTVKDAIDRDFDFRFFQLDKWITSGVELQARYDNGLFFSELGIARRLKNKVCDEHSAMVRNIAAGFDPNRKTPTCVDDGFNVGYTQNMQMPLWMVDWTLIGRFLQQKLEAGARLHYHSGYQRRTVYDQDTPDANTLYNGPRLWHEVFLVDAFLRYRLEHDLAIELSGTNLTDRYYVDPLSRSVMPAPGRTVKIGLSKKF